MTSTSGCLQSLSQCQTWVRAPLCQGDPYAFVLILEGASPGVGAIILILLIKKLRQSNLP